MSKYTTSIHFSSVINCPGQSEIRENIYVKVYVTLIIILPDNLGMISKISKFLFIVQ